jgi:hypothetical protein
MENVGGSVFPQKAEHSFHSIAITEKNEDFTFT